MTNPFDLDHVDDGDVFPLLNLATGVVMPNDDAFRLVNAQKDGEQHMKNFVEKRLNTNTVRFWESLPRLNIKTFKSLSKKKEIKATDEKMQTVTADRDLFGGLLIAANSRDVNLGKVLSFELSTVPFSLAHADGTLRKATKSVLLVKLELTVTVEPRISTDSNPPATVHIIDWMGLVQMLKSRGASTFGELADKPYDMVTSPYRQPGCNRVDVVFERYDRVPSIKSGERQRRSLSSPSLEVMISEPNTPIQKRWNTFIAVEKNKANLTDFLSNRLCELAQAKLHHGHQLVLAGGFQDE